MIMIMVVLFCFRSLFISLSIHNSHVSLGLRLSGEHAIDRATYAIWFHIAEWMVT